MGLTVLEDGRARGQLEHGDASVVLAHGEGARVDGRDPPGVGDGHRPRRRWGSRVVGRKAGVGRPDGGLRRGRVRRGRPCRSCSRSYEAADEGGDGQSTPEHVFRVRHCFPFTFSRCVIERVRSVGDRQ